MQLVHATVNLYDDGDGTITIIDNDGTEPTVGFAMADQDVQEGTTDNVAPAIMVTLTDGSGNPAPSGRTITVQFALTEGTALDPEDYALSSGGSTTVTFMPTETSKALPIEIKPDDVDEDDEMFTIMLSGESNATLGTAMSTITIKDDDDPSVVSIDTDKTVVETETDISGTIAVTLDRASSKPITVPYTVAAGSATTADFTLTAGEVMFIPGDTTKITPTSRDITFMVTGDALDENDEQFTITIGAPTPTANATLSSAVTGTVTIEDNDAMPALTMADAAADEGDGTTNGSVEFTPTLSTASGRDVVVTYSTAPSGSHPVDDNDYTAVPVADAVSIPPVEATTITIPAGETTPRNIAGDAVRPISIATRADDVPEYDETFTLTYSADFATTASTSATGTINNDDGIGLSIAANEKIGRCCYYQPKYFGLHSIP